MSRVEQLVSTLQETLEELVRIEEESNRSWRQDSDELNVLDHELEIVPLNGGQLSKIASYRKKLRIKRRVAKNDWFAAKAFNDSFQTVRILNSIVNGRRVLSRQIRQGENLIEDRGLITSILAGDKDIPLGSVQPTDSEVLEETARQIAAAFAETEEAVDVTN